MILGIGIDSVEIDRFINWYSWTPRQLARIASPQEVRYCLEAQKPDLFAQRYAVRFAAREAFYKALGHLRPSEPIPFLTLCKKVSVEKTKDGVPFLQCDWTWIGRYVPETKSCRPLISLTHTKTTATALVILTE